MLLQHTHTLSLASRLVTSGFPWKPQWLSTPTSSSLNVSASGSSLAEKSSLLALWDPTGESHWPVTLQFMRHSEPVHQSAVAKQVPARMAAFFLLLFLKVWLSDVSGGFFAGLQALWNFSTSKTYLGDFQPFPLLKVMAQLPSTAVQSAFQNWWNGGVDV